MHLLIIQNVVYFEKKNAHIVAFEIFTKEIGVKEFIFKKKSMK